MPQLLVRSYPPLRAVRGVDAVGQPLGPPTTRVYAWSDEERSIDHIDA